MTRFMMSLDDAVDLVLFLHSSMLKQVTFSFKKLLLQQLRCWHSHKGIIWCHNEIRVIWSASWRKMYEKLCTSEEMAKAEDLGDFYRVPADLRDLNYSQYVDKFGHRVDCPQYNSDNTRRLSVDEMKELLLSLDYVKDELENTLKPNKHATIS